jgi:hypothetical protein
MRGYLLILDDIVYKKGLNIKRVDKLFMIVKHVMKNGESRLEVVISNDGNCLLDNILLILK